MLILVHALIAAHVVQWMITGVTVSPVEPSESMYTLEVGRVNAGFIFFGLAILSTLIFGRFFCGWGCHVVALQDWCTHIMNKIGVRPKPFRSRLLVWAPVLLAFYMFAWATVRREVVSPLWQWSWDKLAGLLADGLHAGETFASVLRSLNPPLPWWMGQVTEFPGLTNAVVTEDFWATFPPWYVAIPFLAICGFATVYFLGSKGFCTYGCPYGGIFGPVDRIALGRIVVNDKCEGCGHCTAVCTSNVRVHQEVRDYGMVVDAGCMKCMDCVSVCPNDALSFGFKGPAGLAKPRTEEARKKKVRRPDYDLSWGGELAVFGVAFALLLAFRGMLNQVPLLMAVAMAGIGAFCVWKLWSIATVPNVRLQSLQLRTKGRVTRTGAVFAVLTVLMLVVAAWSGLVRASRVWADRLDAQVTVSVATVFSPAYEPTARDRDVALRALAHFKRSDSPSHGGLGWQLTPAHNTRAAWLSLVAGEREDAKTYLQRAMMQGQPNEEMIVGYRNIVLGLQRGSEADFVAVLDDVLEAHPGASHARVARAYAWLRLNRLDDAVKELESVLRAGRHAEEGAQRRAAEALLQLGRVDRARELLDELLPRRPLSASLRTTRATVALLEGRGEEGVKYLREAIDRQPRNPTLWAQLSQVLRELGRDAEAQEAEARLRELTERAAG